MAITFDDGYRDNLLVAKPLLEELGTSGHRLRHHRLCRLGRDFWWDELEAFCASAGVASRELWQELKATRTRNAPSGSTSCGPRSTRQRPASSLPLSASELERLADGGLVALGAHTVTHPHLSSLPVPAQRNEIEASKAYLAEIVGRPVKDFSYPHGDFSQETRALVRSAGFETACTTHSAPVTDDDEPLRAAADPGRQLGCRHSRA